LVPASGAETTCAQSTSPGVDCPLWTANRESVHCPLSTVYNVKMQPIQHVLPAAVAEIVRRAPTSPEKIAFAWQAAVGPAIARATVIAVGAEGVLDVRVSTEAWRRELKRSAPVIVHRLEELLGPGVIARLRIAGSHPEPHAERRRVARRRGGSSREGTSLRTAAKKSASRARKGSKRKG
jgi:hypothetical protein